MNRKPTPAQFKSTISAEKDRFLFLKSSSKIKPIIEAFTTGNAALDKARYEAYLKKWYYENDKDYYYHYYAPEELMRYQKERSKGK